MSFGSFIRGIAAQVNPFDNGKTYSAYNPVKRKPQPGDPGYVNPIPAPRVNPLQPPNNQPQTQIKPQTPQNLFAGLNANLTLPGAPKTNITVNPSPNLSLNPLPSPGTVIRPNQPVLQPQPKPQIVPVAHNTGFWGHVGNALKTGAQTAIGTVANIPEVGLAAARAGTGIVQGATQIPHLVTAATATGTQKLNAVMPNRITSAINTGAQGANTGVKAVTNVVDRPFNYANRGLDLAAKSYAAHVPIAAGGAQVYRAEQIPLNILAALLTAGGSTAAEAGQAGRLGEAGNAGRFSRFFNAPRTSNADNVISRTSQAVSNKTTPVVQSLNRPISSARAGITQLINSRVLPTVERGAVDAGEAGNIVADAGNPTQIPVRTGIDVNAPPTEPVTIPVRNPTPAPTGPLIREVGGDAPNVTRMPTPDEIAASRFQNQATGRPDQNIEGISRPAPIKPFVLDPKTVATSQAKVIDDYADMLRSVGEGNGTQLVPDGQGGYLRTSNNYRPGVASNKRMTKAEWRQEAEKQLRAGQADSSVQKAFNESADPEVQSQLVQGEQPVAPQGRPIAVKSIKGINVTDNTDVPQNLPETPGTVRATTQTSPMNAKTEAVANAPTVAPPAALPKDVQNVLDNPKQFNKRQVAAARNQRTLARQVAKTQEQTAEAVDRIKTASPDATSTEGFTDTGQFGKSANGGAYQKVGRASEMQQAAQETLQMSPGDVIKTARDNQTNTGTFNRRDIRNVMAMFESKRIPRGSPEYNEAKAILKEDGTHQAQALALRGGNVIRRTATADQLTSQYESKIYRLVDDPTKIDSKSFDEVDAAEQHFTAARDTATEAYNRFTEAPTHANAKIYHAAQDAADKADKDAKMTEFKVAQSVLKNNKDVKQIRQLQKMAKDADLYQMDAVDASMLSGTGTFSRNLVNSVVGGGEEGLFGGLASRVANKITGENVGGGFGRGTISGFNKGAHNIVDASKARASNAGRNPLEHIKNWATTGNQLGDSIIDSQVTHNVIDHYTQLLKDQGYKGRELTDRASVMARQDPDDVGKVYAGYARAAAGLGSGITKSSKVESVIREGISNAISGGNPNQVSELTAKLITRMTVGFPSAVGRTIVEGGKRATLGAPTALRLFTKAARNDPAVRAQIIKESIKQAGTGATAGAIFYKLGQEGLVTGSYPVDPGERARWQREGITENSIKVGNNYYQLPSYLGSAALPALFAATLGRNNGDVAKSAGEVAKGLPSILPTDQASNVLDFINGKTDAGKFIAQTGASAVRALEPGGAFLNQIAKSFDPTTNDTTSGSNLANFVDKVLSGIPGENKFANIPDKVDDANNVIHNPGALPLAFGASTASQDKGVQRTNNINDQTNSALKTISDAGGLSDPNIKAILDDTTKKIYGEVEAGKQVSPSDLKKLQTAMVKGVSATGDDTAYLEKGQYGTNLTALNLKRDEMAADPTTKPSDLQKMDTAIKRGQVYKDNKTPYDLISAYKSTSLADWRTMGTPPGDKNYDPDVYDPDMYQKLYDIDQQLTKAGVSYKTGHLDKPKYTAKDTSTGSGASKKQLDTSFGTLKAGVGAPTVQQYANIDTKSGVIPRISIVRPNIVHKISSSG